MSDDNRGKMLERYRVAKFDEMQQEIAQLREHIKRLLQHSGKRLDIEAENLDYACDEAIKEMDRQSDHFASVCADYETKIARLTEENERLENAIRGYVNREIRLTERLKRCEKVVELARLVYHLDGHADIHLVNQIGRALDAAKDGKGE